MILGWLVKLVVAFAVLGVAAFELGSPLVVRTQLDDAAHEAADSARADLAGTGIVDGARAEAQRVADGADAELTEFAVDEQGTVRVELRKQARSWFLKKWSVTEDWYDVSVAARSGQPTSEGE